MAYSDKIWDFLRVHGLRKLSESIIEEEDLEEEEFFTGSAAWRRESDDSFKLKLLNGSSDADTDMLDKGSKRQDVEFEFPELSGSIKGSDKGVTVTDPFLLLVDVIDFTSLTIGAGGGGFLFGSKGWITAVSVDKIDFNRSLS